MQYIFFYQNNYNAIPATVGKAMLVPNPFYINIFEQVDIFLSQNPQLTLFSLGCDVTYVP